MVFAYFRPASFVIKLKCKIGRLKAHTTSMQRHHYVPATFILRLTSSRIVTFHPNGYIIRIFTTFSLRPIYSSHHALITPLLRYHCAIRFENIINTAPRADIFSVDFQFTTLSSISHNSQIVVVIHCQQKYKDAISKIFVMLSFFPFSFTSAQKPVG